MDLQTDKLSFGIEWNGFLEDNRSIISYSPAVADANYIPFCQEEISVNWLESYQTFEHIIISSNTYRHVRVC